MYSICSSGKQTQVQQTELYGFFAWIMTAASFFGYQFWAYVPEHILQSLGIHYIPNKYMAVAIPAWLGMSAWCILMLYLSHSMMHTHSKESYFTMQDRHSALAHPRDIDGGPTIQGKIDKTSMISRMNLGDIRNRTPAQVLNIDPYKKIPDCVELPITVVNNVLYANYGLQ
ncbi:hypothetical protein FGO68_gene9029 [Halteria grandinella]|uniref:PIG-P domain-containing protein n=1 Tax=Halteria grandinella TaxID=5974 RepID=A0A8J8NC25_HALGN|nr:hypothetical protein FGO68_gene9029 [Halteria grandinella]